MLAAYELKAVERMRHAIQRRAISLGRWLLVLLVFVFIARRLASSLPELRAADLTVSIPWLIASVILLSGYMAGSALIWHYLTLVIGTAIPLRRAAAAWFYSQIFKYLPGKIFLYLARLHFYVREGHSAGPVSLGVAVELIAVLAAMMIVALVWLFATKLHGSSLHTAALLGLFVGLIAFLHPRILNRAVLLASTTLRRSSFPVTVSHGKMLRVVGLHALNWLVLSMALFALVRSFYPITADTILSLSGAFALATLIGMAAVFTPAGLGVREGSMVLLLAGFMPDGVAVITALASRVWLLVGELLCIAFISMVRGALRRPTRMEFEELRRIEASKTGLLSN